MTIQICEAFVLCFRRRFVGWPWVHHLAHFQASTLPVWRRCVLHPRRGSNPAGRLPADFLWTERAQWIRGKSAVLLGHALFNQVKTSLGLKLAWVTQREEDDTPSSCTLWVQLHTHTCWTSQLNITHHLLFLSHSAQLRKVPGLERAAVHPNPSVKKTTCTGYK